MSRTDRGRATYFTQPLRQILAMVMVALAVGAGGALVFGKVWPVVLDNPWLNGLIFAVFCLGVIGCFLQVVQIVGSVRWIESFAAGLTPAADPPRLLAPLAALLRSRAPGRGAALSASSARSILDSVSARIEEARDITRYLSNLLIFLGLLGTLYGLSTTVPAVVDTIRALAPKDGESSAQVFSKLMTGLESQLGGMGTAFSSSLLGLAGSLVVGLLELFASHSQNRYYTELEDWLSGFTRLSLAGSDGEGDTRAVLSALADHLDAQSAFFEDQRTTRAEEVARSDEAMLRLAHAVSSLAARLEADRVANDAHHARLAEVLTRLGDAGAGDAESRMRLRSIDQQMLRLLEEVSAGRQESLGDLRGDIAQLIRAVRGKA